MHFIHTLSNKVENDQHQFASSKQSTQVDSNKPGVKISDFILNSKPLSLYSKDSVRIPLGMISGDETRKVRIPLGLISGEETRKLLRGGGKATNKNINTGYQTVSRKYKLKRCGVFRAYQLDNVERLLRLEEKRSFYQKKENDVINKKIKEMDQQINELGQERHF